MILPTVLQLAVTIPAHDHGFFAELATARLMKFKAERVILPAKTATWIVSAQAITAFLKSAFAIDIDTFHVDVP
jgi:hypothetical protein